MTYTVSTVYRDDTDKIATTEIGRYSDKVRAMNAAKRAARTRDDCISYGPSSLAYVGNDITAVVAW